MARSSWRRAKRVGRKRPLWQKLLLLLPFLLAVVLFIEWQMAPLIGTVALQQAHSKTLAAMTQAVGDQIRAEAESLDYQQLMHIERDSEGRITLLVPDTMRLNAFIADVVVNIESAMEALMHQKISLPLGAVSGSALLADLGPEIKYGFRYQGLPRVEVEDDFVSAGINQVRHRIYLRVESDIRVVVPFTSNTSTVSATVLLSEGIIVGYTPDTYVSLDGLQIGAD